MGAVMHHDPLAMLFSVLGNWCCAEMLSGQPRPDVEWCMKTDGHKAWRLRIAVNGVSVFDDVSTYAGQLAIDAERAFRKWVDLQPPQSPTLWPKPATAQP
jgi:hypothetical protein